MMYAFGQGVVQSNAYAHMWWSISSSAGSATALKNLDIIEKKMTKSDIFRAKKLKQECTNKKYKGC